MRELWNYPLGPARAAFTTLVGWVAAVVLTSFGGFYAGDCIRAGHLFPPWEILIIFVWLPLLALVSLQVLGAFLVTIAVLFAGIASESLRLRLALACANAVVWGAIGAWLHATLVL